jgi:hypothetical protein
MEQNEPPPIPALILSILFINVNSPSALFHNVWQTFMSAALILNL